MAHHPYIDIFSRNGVFIGKWCSLCKPEADSAFHLYAAVQCAIDEGRIVKPGIYIAALTGKRPVAARQYVVIGERDHLTISVPPPPSAEDIERWDTYNVTGRANV